MIRFKSLETILDRPIVFKSVQLKISNNISGGRVEDSIRVRNLKSQLYEVVDALFFSSCFRSRVVGNGSLGFLYDVLF